MTKAQDNVARSNDGAPAPAAGYKAGRQRREIILDAAFEHFAEYGYHGASMREIASLTGVTHAGLRYHYPTKDDLLLAVLERRSHQGDEFFAGTFVSEQSPEQGSADPDDVWNAIGRFVDYLLFSFQRKGMVQLFTTQAIAASDPDYPAHEFYKKRYDSMRADFRGALAVIQQAGVLPADLDIDAAASEIIALTEGLQIQWLLQPAQVNYVRTLEHYLSGLVVPEARDRLHQIFAKA